ncbi:MAG: zinc ribbon domain-containing protein [Planctomycetes bacterium]|nr:zinc ribbon domain-containing protein [Planctomycetota bacterium]
MPTYEYECGSCAHRFERFQPITAAPVRRCPECGKRVRRLIGAGSGLIFRGSGFYITDYRSPKSDYQSRARAESGTPKDPGTAKGASKDTGKSAGASSAA